MKENITTVFITTAEFTVNLTDQRYHTTRIMQKKNVHHFKVTLNDVNRCRLLHNVFKAMIITIEKKCYVNSRSLF